MVDSIFLRGTFPNLLGFMPRLLDGKGGPSGGPVPPYPPPHPPPYKDRPPFPPPNHHMQNDMAANHHRPGGYPLPPPGLRIPFPLPLPPPPPHSHPHLGHPQAASAIRIAASNPGSRIFYAGPKPLHMTHGTHYEHRWRGEYDEYAGLMSQKEKQKLVHIQLMQLHTDKPYVEDYYYMVYMSRGEKQMKEDMRAALPEGMRLENRNYTPAQFENSLGKLQVVSVTAPRKIMDVCETPPHHNPPPHHHPNHPHSNSPSNPLPQTQPEPLTPPQREGRRFKQLLLEVEKLYAVFLALDEVKRRQETALEGEVIDHDVLRLEEGQYLGRLANAFLNEERVAAYLCVRKGKHLVRRLLPFLPLESQQCIVSALLSGLSWLSKRDQSDQVLPRLFPEARSCVMRSPFSALVRWAKCLHPHCQVAHSSSASTPTRATPTGRAMHHKGNLNAAFANKVGLSLLLTMLTRAEQIYLLATLEEQEQWGSFVTAFTEALGGKGPSGIAEPMGIFPEAERHLMRLKIPSQRYSAALEAAFGKSSGVE